MEKANAGQISIAIYGDGYPVSCVLTVGEGPGAIQIRLRHDELADLRYVAKRAMQKARQFLPERYKDEV